MAIADMDTLKSMMRAAGADRLYVKRLSENDNSKNQPYLGGDFSALNILPFGEVKTETIGKRPNFKATLNFSWLLDDGSLVFAPHSKLILYPKYPEVRFSGFLLGCQGAPNDLMNVRLANRLLFFGITAHGKIIGYVTGPDTSLANSFHALPDLPQVGVFYEVQLDTGVIDARKLLLSELKRIHLVGWIGSKKLIGPGQYGACIASHCNGMTLEAELGIMPNGFSEPDFHGWEVKQHSVTNLTKPNTGVLTLMTPEPTAGFYKERGVEAFIRQYGYADKMGREDRMNFGGIHKVGERQASTGLTMMLEGYNQVTGKIEDTSGGITLRDDKGNNAAEWKFANVIEHWKRKHARAVYVPSIKGSDPLRYQYGNLVRLGTGTDPLKLLSALSKKSVYYDPGIKLEGVSTNKPKTKRRSQFRIKLKSISTLYNNMEMVDLLR